MSKIYWINQGIGVRSSELYPHLDSHKCFVAVCQQLPNEEINEDEFELDDFFYGRVFENLGDFMCHLDDADVLTYGDNNCGESYFYYPPSYPWERTDNEPLSLTDVHERIIDAIVKVTNLTRKQADALIDDDIYEYGCG